MRKIRLYSFSMIELLIAIGLTGLLMSTLGYFYRQLEEINISTEESLYRLYEISYAEDRLFKVLPKAVAENSAEKDFFFFSERSSGNPLFKEGTGSLLFVYDNGIQLDKPFSNKVLGRLFVDPQGLLTLAIWPSPSRWKDDSPPMKKEILLNNVEAINFSFFIAPKANRDKIKGNSGEVEAKRIFRPEPTGVWVEEWRSEYYQLPAIVKISLKRHIDKKKEPEEYTFSFPMPNSPKLIIYSR